MEKLARAIVKYRYIFAIIILAMIIASFFTIGWVQIEESVTEYLPDDTNTKKALAIMEKEFVTYGSATIMVKDVTLDEAKNIVGDLGAIEGVRQVSFKGDESDYKDSKALIEVTFVGGATDEKSKTAYDKVVAHMSDYSMVIPAPLTNDIAGRLRHDVAIVLALCAVIIIVILILTSESYAEVIVFPIVFVVAALTNMGTNFWFGKISFVSNTVCVILQLALAIDYSIILCRRFTAEKATAPSAKDAMAIALSKAIPEILSSCLTTISGLLALVTMSLKLGQDLGLVLAKSILFSIFMVIFLMPTLLLWVTKLMDKSTHKSFVPAFKGWTRGMLKARKVLPVIFLCFVLALGITSSQIDFAYSLDNIDTYKPTDVQVAIAERTETFGNDNMLVVLVPREDYKNEREIIDKALSHKEVKSALGISNIEFGGTYAVDALTPSELSHLTNMNEALIKTVYTKYATEHHIVGDVNEMRVPLIDMALYVVDYVENANIELSGDIAKIAALLKDADDQLIGDNYTRVLFKIDFPVDGKEVFAFTDNLEKEFKAIDGGIILAGETMSSHDLASSFETDMFIISILTGLFVFIILVFTFKSWGLPIVLVAIIQGAILINFGIVPILGDNFYFFVYLIVSAIQMGATIDYAILVTNHYKEERLRKPKDIAIYDAMTASFPTVITSGTILIIAPLFVGIFISDPLVSSLGYCLSRGSLISILSVLTVLPELLYTFENVLLKTTFRFRKSEPKLVFVADTEGESTDMASVEELAESATPNAESIGEGADMASVEELAESATPNAESIGEGADMVETSINDADDGEIKK